ncbi:hypothetical protein AcV7_005619 [Taiwanofungus camphoratus]|nr:hypothetical protein AcV7_005619 [Antrodia cinnamomea]
MVRLITHNLLACHAKGCTSNNFPLQFKDAQIEIRDAEFNPDFLRGFIPRIEWAALVNAARQLGDTSLPDEPPEMLDDEFLQKLHHVLFQVCCANFLISGPLALPTHETFHADTCRRRCNDLSQLSAFLSHL